MSEARLQRQQMLGHILLGEISNVIIAMRQNTKWDTRTRMAASPLVKNIEQLKQKIESLPDRNIFQLDTLEYLSPFLEVIKSEETSGPITAVALSAVHKFIVRQFLGPESNNPAKGVRHIVQAVAHCRFEATDQATDEVVLMKILQVLLACLLSPAGHLLTNKLVYDMIQTCFKMSTQSRLSVLLRRSAEMTLQEMVQCVFSRFYAMQDLDPQPQSLTQGSTQSQSLPYLSLGFGGTRDSSPAPASHQPLSVPLANHNMPPRTDSDSLKLSLDDSLLKVESIENYHPIVAVSPTVTPIFTPMIPRREKENIYEDSETSDATQPLTTSGGEDTGNQTTTHPMTKSGGEDTGKQTTMPMTKSGGEETGNQTTTHPMTKSVGEDTGNQTTTHPMTKSGGEDTGNQTPTHPMTKSGGEDTGNQTTTQPITKSVGGDTGNQTITEPTNGSTNDEPTETSPMVCEPSLTEPKNGTGGIVSATGVETPNHTVIPTETLSSNEGVTDPILPEININSSDGVRLDDSESKYSESEGAITEKKKT